MADKIPVKALFSGSDVVALGEFEPTDTIALSLISGFAAGVTTELGNNSITTLGDVYDSISPTDGQVLTYDTTNGWQAESPTPGITDHTLLSNIGTNTHAQIDTHIGDSTIHFAQSAISITESQISDLQSYLLNITGESIADLSDVFSSMSPTDGQVLTYDTTNGWQAETPAANGGSKFFHHNAGLAQTFSAATTILFNTAGIAEADYSYASGEVTINRTDWYNISYEVTAVAATNSRTTSTHQLEVNTVLVPGSISNGYHRNISNGEQTATANVLVLLTAGDVVRVRSSGTNNITTIANGCRLTIESK